jgi:beta-lactam-binding protein with PASTA domain
MKLVVQFLTQHGQYLTVPAVTGKNTAEAISILEEKGFEVAIQDSVYVDTAKMGIVLKQLPDPNSTVKINRTVLLTVNRVTLPLVEMPALQGKTLSYALLLLTRSHLELGDTIFKTDFTRGNVMEQSFRGNLILSGAKLPWVSRIDLVISKGLGAERIIVPDLEGMTLAEAILVLEQNGITLGSTIPFDNNTITDTSGAFVVKQNPPRFTEDKQLLYIQAGQVMDVWISPIQLVVKDSTIIQ